MNNKYRIIIVSFVVLCLVLAGLACGSEATSEGEGEPVEQAVEEAADVSDESTEADQEEEAAEPTSEPTPEPTSTPEPEPVGFARSNPAPIGEAVSAENFSFTVNSVTRPADDIVAQGNMFNLEPEEGQEYVMVEVSVTCLQSECNLTLFNFGIIGSTNVVHEPEIFVSGVDGMLESVEMLQDATTSGKIFFLVEQDETALVLRWEPFIGKEIFMALDDAALTATTDTSGTAPDVEEIDTSLENPGPLGTEIAVPNFVFLVNSVTRPADDIVANANEFNTVPEAGQEYLMVEMTVTCRQPECSFAPTDFTVLGSTGVAHELELFVAGVDDTLEFTELLQGASVTGKLFFFVQQGETGLVLRWEPLVGNESFLALE